MKYEINEELANETLKYLQTRPFIEVHELMYKLMNLKKIEEKAKTE